VDANIYVAVADGNTAQSSVGLQLWEVGNPQQPAETATARFMSDAGDDMHGPQLFSYAENHYLALVDKTSEAGQMRIHEISHCLDNDGCRDLMPALAREDLQISLANYHYLDVSFSNGLPLLHYGMETTGLFGSGFERLWELESLPRIVAPDTLPELTDGGGSYTDPCDGAPVDYFGDYYINNDYGLDNFNPRHAVFSGPFMYRAATGILDVHVRYEPACGDGVLQQREECDDGNEVDNDGCTNSCTSPVCGDGVVQDDEMCDDPEDPGCVDCMTTGGLDTGGAGTDEGTSGAPPSSEATGNAEATGSEGMNTGDTGSGAGGQGDRGGCGCTTRRRSNKDFSGAFCVVVLLILGRRSRSVSSSGRLSIRNCRVSAN
jgi:cysteine-rich repeat protein